MAKKKRKASRHKIRFFLAFIVFSGITLALCCNLFSNVKNIRQMKVEKKELEKKITILAKEKDVLESDILKLKDPEYIAKYVREKYFYSKDGEVILRMDEKK